MNQNFYRILNDNFNKYSDNIFIEEESGEKWKYNDIKKLTSQFSTFLRNLSLKKGSRIKFFAHDTHYDVDEVGHFIIDRKKSDGTCI